MPVFHNIFQLLDQPMVLVRFMRDTVVVEESNRAFTRMTGLYNEQLQGMHISKMIGNYCYKNGLRAFRKETFLYNSKHCRIPVLIEQKLLEVTSHDQNALAIIIIQDLSTRKWIELQQQTHKVLISGTVDDSNHIRFIKDLNDPNIFYPEKDLENETLLQFISEAEFAKINEMLPSFTKLKKLQPITVKTNMLSGVELELKVIFTPMFDGFGKIIEYAFVILDLNPVNDSIDSSMKLKIWMAKRDISASQLSDATNISLQTISKLRNGKIKMPQRLTAELIASELRVDVKELWPEVRKGR